MTVSWRTARADSLHRLRTGGVTDADLELRWIVERASGRTPAEQVAALDEPVTEREMHFLRDMVQRRAAGEPLQYVLGRWGFRTLDLLVDHRVLIPRPETEVVAGHAVDAASAVEGTAVVVDLGTGSGAIALSVAAERWPHVEVWATDASADALAVARANLAGLGRRAGVVRLLEGDWYTALPGHLRGGVHVIVSNPPYVAADEPLPSEVADWEPSAALVPGPTGLEAVEVIVAGAREWLVPEGWLLVEIGEAQGAAAAALAVDAGFADVTVAPDLAGRDRVLVAHG